MNQIRFAFCAVITTLFVITVINGVPAQEQPAKSADPQVPIYKPPLRGAPKSRVAGGTRGLGNGRPTLSVLAPDHTGWTTKAQPTLYWYVSKRSAMELEFALAIDKVAIPVLEKIVQSQEHAGVHNLRLADHGIQLKRGVDYRWSVALIPDRRQRSKDIIASGTIQRVPLSQSLQTKLAKVSAGKHVLVYADEGVWYDALDAISTLIRKNPNNKALRKQRAALLEQVGLNEAADFDRKRAGGQ